MLKAAYATLRNLSQPARRAPEVDSKLNALEDGELHRLADWPNDGVSAVAAGAYTVWEGEKLVYAGMAGRSLTAESILEHRDDSTRVTGLRSRLASHASGRRSGDQFCVYVVPLELGLGARGASRPLRCRAVRGAHREVFRTAPPGAPARPTYPELARTGTQFARALNIGALGRLNTGLGARLGLYKTNGGGQIFPSSPTGPWTSVRDFDESIYAQHATPHTEGPGTPLLAKYLANTHAPGAPHCSAAKFSEALLKCIDKNGNDGLSPNELVAAARAMKLKVGGSGGNAACDKAQAAVKCAKHNSPRPSTR